MPKKNTKKKPNKRFAEFMKRYRESKKDPKFRKALRQISNITRVHRTPKNKKRITFKQLKKMIEEARKNPKTMAIIRAHYKQHTGRALPHKVKS